MTLKLPTVASNGIRFLATLFLTSVVASPASAAVIDFESLSLDEFVTDQFAAEGVLFSNAVNLVEGISLYDIDFPPSSGTNVIAGLDLGPIEATFPVGASFVGLQMTTALDASVQFFDVLDALLGEILVAPNLGSHTLVSFDSSSSIARVTIGDQWMGSAFFLTVDDFEFASSAVPEPTVGVPEPSVLALTISGLIPLAAFGVLRRRRLKRRSSIAPVSGAEVERGADRALSAL
jgi:hypothetical protein